MRTSLGCKLMKSFWRFEFNTDRTDTTRRALGAVREETKGNIVGRLSESEKDWRQDGGSNKIASLRRVKNANILARNQKNRYPLDQVMVGGGADE